MKPVTLLLMLLSLAPVCWSATTADRSGEQPSTARRTLFLIGDSTVKNGTKGQLGWGTSIAAWFDATRIRVENRALGGRSSRTFFTEGLWDKVLAELTRGDFVIMQFGHNDGGGLNDPRNRASIKGNGNETQEVTDPKTGRPETVHSYGWYLRKCIADTKGKGAAPIVCSPVPRNIWKDGQVTRARNDYGRWAAEAAQAGGAAFIDLNELVARRHEEAGAAKVRALYFGSTDHTHTTAAGAELNAAAVVEGIASLKDCALADFLRAESTVAPKPVAAAGLRQPIPDGLVVLTFDDACLSHATNVAPLLKRHGFGATFFVCEYQGFEDKTKYMTWEQIRSLHEMGFEVANHTRSHTHVTKLSKPQFVQELFEIESRCASNNIPKPASFAYPAYVTTPEAVATLAERGYRFARAGGSRPYRPNLDDPLLIPSFSTTGTDKARVLAALEQAHDGQVVVLTIHGVPDHAHPHVNTPPELFLDYLQFLRDRHCTVIALRDLDRYVDPAGARRTK